jgi:hypothetical protein
LGNPEFRAGEGETVESSSPTPEGHVDLIRRALRLLAEKHGDPWINKATILPMVKRLDPTFDVTDHGYTSFSGMLKELDELVEVRKGEYDQQVRLR